MEETYALEAVPIRVPEWDAAATKPSPPQIMMVQNKAGGRLAPYRP